MAAAPGDTSSRQVAAGSQDSSSAQVIAPPEKIFDPQALRHAVIPAAESKPSDWTEDEVSAVIEDYAEHRGHSSAASGVPDAVVTDAPPSGGGYLSDATTASSGLVVQIDEATRLVGWEQVALVSKRELTVRADPTGRLEVVHDRGVDGGDLWDLAGLRGARSGPALVVGNADQDSLATMARIGRAAVRQASSLWGPDWDRRLVIVAPRTLEEFADELDDPPTTARGFAAVTSGRASVGGGQSVGEQEFVGSRVFVNPDAWQAMTEGGRLFVLSHEATHVAAQGAARPRPPDWLAEGVADEVGSRASGITEAQLVRPLLDVVRTAGPPASLPTDEEFSGDDASGGARAYAGADVAVLLIERTYGRAALRRLFRDTTTLARGGRTQSAALAEAMHEDLGTTPAAFTKAWQAELRRLVAH